MLKGLVLGVMLLFLPVAVCAQNDAPRWEAAGGYSYVRANIFPSCGCFNGHGGSGSLVFRPKAWLGVVGELGAVHSGDIQGSGRDLTLFTYQGGLRLFIAPQRRATPFVHVLAGGGRASGSLYDVPIPGRSGTGPDNSIAVTLGVGLDVKAGKHLSLRLVQADWLYTQFHNGANDKQHNLRISAGIVFRFGS